MKKWKKNLRIGLENAQHLNECKKNKNLKYLVQPATRNIKMSHQPSKLIDRHKSDTYPKPTFIYPGTGFECLSKCYNFLNS